MNCIQNIGNKLFQPNQPGWVAFLFLLLLIPNITGLFWLSDLEGSLLMKLAYLGFAAMLWIIPALFLKMRVYFMLMSLFLWLAPIEIAHIYMNRMPVTMGFLSAIVNTSWHEAVEVATSYIWLLLLFLLIIIVYYVTVFRVNNTYLFTRKASHYLMALIFLGNLFLYACMLYLPYRTSGTIQFEHTNDSFLKKYRKIYPYDMIFVGYRAASLEKEKRDLQKQLSDFSFGVRRELTTDTKEIYIVVIGETARYGNFSINGYKRQTTPELEKLNNLLTFSDVMACGNLTEVVLPILLTRSTPNNTEIGYKEKTFVDAFSEAGFQTAWIGNQSSIYRFIQRLATDADYHYFSPTDFDATANYDETLFPYVDEVLSIDNPKQLIVVQTLGSHYRYNFRYPDSYDIFKPSMEGTTGPGLLSPVNKEILINSYDNTIRYTDYFLSTLIRKIEEENAASVIMYISDHAENLYDDDKQLILHGNGQFSPFEVHVPLLVWASDTYIEKCSEKWETMQMNTTKRLSSVNLFHTILDIAAITYPGAELEKSFASPYFREDSVRYILMPDQNVIEYNQ